MSGLPPFSAQTNTYRKTVIVEVYWHCSSAEWLGTCAEKLYVKHSRGEALLWLKGTGDLVASETNQTIRDGCCVPPW